MTPLRIRPQKREELAEHFGDKIAAGDAEATDDKSLPKPERKRLQIETAHKSPRARALKVADKMMVSPPDGSERDLLLDCLAWAEKVVAGCRGVNPRPDQLFNQTVAEARKTL